MSSLVYLSRLLPPFFVSSIGPQFCHGTATVEGVHSSRSFILILTFYPIHRHVYKDVALVATIYIAAKTYATPEINIPPTIMYFMGYGIASHFAFATFILYAEGSFPDH